jgi:hypothetical protein
MSNTKNTGGPAFPVEVAGYKSSKHVVDDLFEFSGTHPGMTLRDYFAAKAMQGMIHRMNGEERWYALQSGLCKEAYEFADAMVKAREQ